MNQKRSDHARRYCLAKRRLTVFSLDPIAEAADMYAELVPLPLLGALIVLILVSTYTSLGVARTYPTIPNPQWVGNLQKKYTANETMRTNLLPALAIHTGGRISHVDGECRALCQARVEAICHWSAWVSKTRLSDRVLDGAKGSVSTGLATKSNIDYVRAKDRKSVG